MSQASWDKTHRITWKPIEINGMFQYEAQFTPLPPERCISQESPHRIRDMAREHVNQSRVEGELTKVCWAPTLEKYVQIEIFHGDTTFSWRNIVALGRSPSPEREDAAYLNAILSLLAQISRFPILAKPLLNKAWTIINRAAWVRGVVFRVPNGVNIFNDAFLGLIREASTTGPIVLDKPYTRIVGNTIRKPKAPLDVEESRYKYIRHLEARRMKLGEINKFLEQAGFPETSGPWVLPYLGQVQADEAL